MSDKNICIVLLDDGLHSETYLLRENFLIDDDFIYCQFIKKTPFYHIT